MADVSIPSVVLAWRGESPVRRRGDTASVRDCGGRPLIKSPWHADARACRLYWEMSHVPAIPCPAPAPRRARARHRRAARRSVVTGPVPAPAVGGVGRAYVTNFGNGTVT